MKKDYVDALEDSIVTATNLKFFKSRQQSSYAHIFKSEQIKYPMSKIREVENFDVNRLCNSATKAYPKHNRPRGQKDITSVKHHIKQIEKKQDILPIWLIKKKGTYTLLDGAHRIVANYIKNKRFVKARVIYM